MIIARVDLRIVVDTIDQLDAELNRIQERSRNHVIGWAEGHYDEKNKPQGRLDLEAVRVVAEKLARNRT